MQDYDDVVLKTPEVERHNNVTDTSSERNDGLVDGHHLFIVLHLASLLY